MLTEFERLARQFRNDPCFYFVDKDGQTRVFSYEEVRSHAAALAFLLYEKGAIRGSYVFVDMANCPAFIFLALAAAYGGFVLVALNHRLTEEEKAMRTVELHSMNNLRVVTQLSEAGVCRLLAKALFLEEDASAGRGGLFRKKKPEHLDPVFRQKSKVFHWLERAVAFYDGKATALVLFTSGTSGRPKAVPLSWDNLSGSAEASNTSLSIQGEGMWQAALPLFHIGGFQIPLRSVLNGRPFVLYRSFNADRILLDAQQFQASHISVVDKMLQALLASPHSAQLQEYRCILLGGAAPNPRTMVEARGHGLRVYVSYGMTETSSQVASSLADEHYDGACALLPGYEAQVVAPDERGFGQLALRGPGVFAGYLNGSAAFTVDGFFLTGDSASIQQGRIKVAERFDDMFVSGGENVYPAEIQDRLLRIAGVSDAYVFGVEDEVWGRRPVALLERGRASARRGDIDSLDESGFWQDTQAGEPGGEDAGPGAETLLSESATPQAFAAEVAKSLEQRLSKINRPRHICVMDSFPRVGLGKPDCTKLRQSYEERLEIREVRLYHIEQRFVNPITTSKTVLRSRESLIVELIDWAGRSGIGECLAFPTDFYLSETLGQDRRVMEATLIPAVLSQIYLHPREASACFDECAQAEFFPMAKAAIEPALWDLYGKITGQALWQLIGGGIEEASGDGSEASGDDSDISGDGSEALLWTRPPCLNPSPQSLAVAAGATFGIATIPQTLEAVGLALSQGYARVKLKIQPGDD
ncbi:MAG: AMP-binding protein, partial [Eggerthellaceae bacterium]|nr:AMP-binding protein [Eggerthellaceae bacterium]